MRATSESTCVARRTALCHRCAHTTQAFSIPTPTPLLRPPLPCPSYSSLGPQTFAGPQPQSDPLPPFRSCCACCSSRSGGTNGSDVPAARSRSRTFTDIADSVCAQPVQLHEGPCLSRNSQGSLSKPMSLPWPMDPKQLPSVPVRELLCGPGARARRRGWPRGGGGGAAS